MLHGKVLKRLPAGRAGSDWWRLERRRTVLRVRRGSRSSHNRLLRLHLLDLRTEPLIQREEAVFRQRLRLEQRPLFPGNSVVGVGLARHKERLAREIESTGLIRVESAKVITVVAERLHVGN